MAATPDPRPWRGDPAEIVAHDQADTDAALAAVLAMLRRPSWQADAACRTESTDAFFPTRGQRVDEAIAVCSGCPVRAECLEYALEHSIEEGVWGGMSVRARRAHKRAEAQTKRRRAG